MSDSHNDGRSRPDAGLVTRRATSADRRAALRHEASLLQMVRHPGVTELVVLADGDGTTEVTTRSGSDQTLADWDGPEGASVDTAVIAGVVAALATTCSDLHRMGVVHGRIEPQRVAISSTGQPVLTGFEASGPIGTMPRPADPALPPFCDPAAGRGQALEPAIDVFGLGALLEHLLERHPPSGRDSVRRARRRLRRLARTATAETPERRPDAAALAASILDAAPAAHLPGDHAASVPPPPRSDSMQLRLPRPAADPGPPRTRRRARSSALVAAALLVLSIGGSVALLRSRPTATSETARASRSAPPAPTTSVPSIPGSIVPAPAAPPPSPSTVAGPTSGPSTTSIPRVTAGSTRLPDFVDVVFEGVRYRIEGGHRRFAVGDWDCDGSATLATLDPSSGALTFFAEWPQAGSTRATSADRVPGALDLRAEPVGGCHRLIVAHADRADIYERIGDSP